MEISRYTARRKFGDARIAMSRTARSFRERPALLASEDLVGLAMRPADHHACSPMASDDYASSRSKAPRTSAVLKPWWWLRGDLLPRNTPV